MIDRAWLEVDARHRSATMDAPTGIFLMDGFGDVTFVNPRACEILGATPGALAGRGFIAFLHPDDRARAAERIASKLVEGDRTQSDYRILRDGAVAWIRVMTSPTRDADGTINGLAGVLDDITAQREMEQHARRLETKLQQTHKLESLGLMASGIAHDFNNLLVGIAGNAAIAEMEVPADSEAGRALAELQLAAERATELTAQLLAFAGRGRIPDGVVDLNCATEDTHTLLRTMLPPRARVTLDLATGLPGVVGDASRLRQVAMNLITNAADALGEDGGEIVVRTAVEPVDCVRRAGLVVDGGLSEGSHVVLEVRDTGCGMTPETLERIFDPFFTTKKKGRGLGLAATVGTIRAHKAGLEVISAPGVGTTFRLLLPATDRAAQKITVRATAVSLNGSGTILVVDDDAAVRDVTRRLLKRQGFDVLEAPDGALGVAALRSAKTRIRCVLLDLTMPGMDGAETLKRMREIDPDIRVVVTSGHSERTIAAQFGSAGIAGVLHKPFDVTSLLRVTKAAIEQPVG